MKDKDNYNFPDSQEDSASMEANMFQNSYGSPRAT